MKSLTPENPTGTVFAKSDITIGWNTDHLPRIPDPPKEAISDSEFMENEADRQQLT
jgi:hypothetical protein